MTDVLIDIETLENAIIALTEGAGDEKRAAVWALEKMLERKTQIVEEFEKEAA